MPKKKLQGASAVEHHEVIKIEKEPVIKTMKPKLVMGLADLITSEADRDDFLLLCKRVEAVVHAWHHPQFEELMQLYSLFEPVHGIKRLEQNKLSPKQVDDLEQRFLELVFEVMERSNFKILSATEVETATSGQYLLNLPIAVDESKLDSRLLTTYFNAHHHDHTPSFINKYVVFRRGTGLDQTTGYFYGEKLDVLISRLWRWIMQHIRSKSGAKEIVKPAEEIGETSASSEKNSLYVKRIHIETMKIRLKNMFQQTTIQEPSFDRIILLYRPATPRKDLSILGDRAIHIKHFKNIPMADMELVFPEKKNPSLTAIDWTKFLISAIIGLVAFVSTLEMHPSDIWVALAILSGFLGYCAKIYLTFQANLAEYQSLIMRSMYDKQLDSGRGTLLHLCDDVIQQEVKEVIIAYFILMTQGKATMEDLDFQCEKLMQEEFNEDCNFEVDDAVKKLEKLGIVMKDSLGRYTHLPLNRAIAKIGMTTEEFIKRSEP